MRGDRNFNLAMIADDDLFIRGLIKTGMGELVRVEEVSDGTLVIDMYKKLLPDILFLDIHLPGAMGLDLLKEILKIDPAAYIIMISADSSQSNVRTAMHYGARGFLTKPFKKERLKLHLNNCPTIKFLDAG